MSYKALLNAKASSTMFSNFGPSSSSSSNTHHHGGSAAALSGAAVYDDLHENGDDHDGMDQDDDGGDSIGGHSDDADDYHNNGGGGGGGDGGTTPERQEDEEPLGFSTFSLKRCRFSPRQDVALLKEVHAADDKPYEHAGKAAWESWGKVATVLNHKQIFGPILTLSALTCKLRFEFLMKNYGSNALKYNPKRGTLEEFQKRDELIAMLAPLVPNADDMSVAGRRRRGRPRKQYSRDKYSPAPEMEDEPIGESFVAGLAGGGHSMLGDDDNSPLGAGGGGGSGGAGGGGGYSNSKRKPGRPRKIASLQGGSSGFLDGAALNDYLRPRGSGKHAASDHHPAATNGVSMAASVPSQIPPVMRYLQQQQQQQQHINGGNGSSSSHHHHHSDAHSLVEYLRLDLESRKRERSEDRRLEREKMEIEREKLEVRKAEIVVEQQKWELEKRERELNLEMLKKKLLK
ncbi:hypothetical protein BV898_06656 [Hypsibius exemplaris]|uniref:Uncharacterized protein n=1 Tax=Hypsibius exemplaris TaxID=2072580 RepID=A0A1W0WVJ3_HYPEX|nr:hypothetical protein BV898_06656 [Hypsibius exemplaris]